MKTPYFNPSRPPLSGGLFKKGTRWKPTLPSAPEVGNQPKKHEPKLADAIKKALHFPAKSHK